MVQLIVAIALLTILALAGPALMQQTGLQESMHTRKQTRSVSTNVSEARAHLSQAASNYVSRTSVIAKELNVYSPSPHDVVDPPNADIKPQNTQGEASYKQSRRPQSTPEDDFDYTPFEDEFEPHLDKEEPRSAPTQERELGLWERTDQSLLRVDDIIRSVYQRLTGHVPTRPMIEMMNDELGHIAHEGRVQALVMELERHQTTYGSKLVQQLRQDALGELTATLLRIKRFEIDQVWAVTEEERDEVRAMVLQMRQEAVSQHAKTLEMGSRRIDEQVDRALHTAHPDFPKRRPQPDDDRTFFETLFGTKGRSQQ